MMNAYEPHMQEAENDAFEGPLSRREFLKLASTGLGSMLLGGALLNQDAKAMGWLKKQGDAPKNAAALSLSSHDKVALAKAKDFGAVENGFPGLSKNQVQQHLGLYHGYVKKHASITEQMASFDAPQLEGANGTYHPFRELAIEQSYALNGALLHEYYFGNLSVEAQAPSANVKNLLQASFNGFEHLKAQLLAAAKSARGWAILGLNTWDGRLHPYVLDTHNMFAPMGLIPVLVLDVYEHAYMIDYGTDRGAYLEAIWPHLNWQVIEERLAMVQAHR